MNPKHSTIAKGFIIAGLMNASVLIFSKLFTDPTIPEVDPQVMSYFGLVMILLWGLAYIAVAKNYHKVKWLIGIFVLEKLAYASVWTVWILNNSVAEVVEKDTLAGIFYATYGLNDWAFFGFFLFVFIRLVKLKDKSQ